MTTFREFGHQIVVSDKRGFQINEVQIGGIPLYICKQCMSSIHYFVYSCVILLQMNMR